MFIKSLIGLLSSLKQVHQVDYLLWNAVIGENKRGWKSLRLFQFSHVGLGSFSSNHSPLYWRFILRLDVVHCIRLDPPPSPPTTNPPCYFPVRFLDLGLSPCGPSLGLTRYLYLLWYLPRSALPVPPSHPVPHTRAVSRLTFDNRIGNPESFALTPLVIYIPTHLLPRTRLKNGGGRASIRIG